MDTTIEQTSTEQTVVNGTGTPGTESPTDEFPMPEEFSADVPTARIHRTDDLPPSSTGSSSTYQPTGSGLDALEGMELDHTQDEVERKKLDAPTGNWNKEDRWEFELFTRTEDTQVGDKNVAGRTYFNFRGKPQSREANGLVYEPTLFLRLSPDKRYKEDKPTEVDMAYKLYLLAKDLYLELKEQQPTARQLVSMLIEDPYVLRTMQGDNGLIVISLNSGKRDRRNRR